MSTMNEAAGMTEASGLTEEQQRIDRAADAVRGMTKDMTKDMMKDMANGRPTQWRRIADMLRQSAMDAPLQSLAIAFLLGILIARRR